MSVRTFLSFLFSIFLFSSHAQQSTEKGKLTGLLVTAGIEEPMPFATISIFSQKDSLIEGSLSDENGKFTLNIPFGTYYALIS